MIGMSGAVIWVLELRACGPSTWAFRGGGAVRLLDWLAMRLSGTCAASLSRVGEMARDALMDVATDGMADGLSDGP